MTDRGPGQGQPRTHVARFVDGPRNGALVTVLALETGQPPEILLTPGRAEWVYVRAGGERSDGSLPYLYMSPTRAEILRTQAVRALGQERRPR